VVVDGGRCCANAYVDVADGGVARDDDGGLSIGSVEVEVEAEAALVLGRSAAACHKDG